MGDLDLHIRNESADDYTDILLLTYEAFLTLKFPGRQRIDEHFLIYLLQESSYVTPELCFVAELNGEIVGHILYTRSAFKRPDGSIAETITFGPLSVSPKYHHRGIGSALVRHSIEEARRMNFSAILITGVPEYYPKLGFKRASKYGLKFVDGTVTDAFMVYELIPGYLEGGGVYDTWAPEFDMVENDNGAYESFHKKFMAEHFSGEIMFRPLYDHDVILMEHWLHMEHITMWYEHPEDWMHEIRSRHKAFSYLNHIIVEIDGMPIGFCQYYDCYCAKEEWYDIERPGEIFSIDYLIGETDYLNRGFGKKIIAKLIDIIQKQGAEKIVVQPDKKNYASVRSLLANGFIRERNFYSLQL